MCHSFECHIRYFTFEAGIANAIPAPNVKKNYICEKSLIVTYQKLFFANLVLFMLF